MPADFSRASSAAIPLPFDQRRRSERRACALRVTLRISAGNVGATLHDLSAGGIGLRVDTLMPLRPGTRFTLVHAELGEVACTMRWSMHPRYGAEFQAGGQSLTRIKALYDSLPRAPGELI